MRIIIPSYSLHDNFTENVAVTLRNMGHIVLTTPVPARFIDHKFMHLMQLGFEKLLPNHFTPQEKWLKKMISVFRPDIMIALTHSVNEELLLDLRKSGVVTIAWWGDTPANMRKEGLLCEGWDFIYLKDSYAVAKLKSIGLNALYLPEAMNPLWHKKVYKSINERIVFAGNAYEYRHYLIRKLIKSVKYGVDLYGSRPPRWAKREVTSVYRSKFIVKEEKSNIFGSAAVCLNSTSMTEGNSLNCRAFEIAGSGGLQIMEYRQAIEDCFDVEKEIVTFSSFEELIYKLDYFINDEVAAIKIREKSFLRAHSSHTYEHRLIKILGGL
jgi:spore maturation protein CgeB